MKHFAGAAGFGGHAPFATDPALAGKIAKVLERAAVAARAPGLYMKRKRIERRNAWLVAHMSPHIRRDVGFDPDMRTDPARNGRGGRPSS